MSQPATNTTNSPISNYKYKYCHQSDNTPKTITNITPVAYQTSATSATVPAQPNSGLRHVNTPPFSRCSILYSSTMHLPSHPAISPCRTIPTISQCDRRCYHHYVSRDGCRIRPKTSTIVATQLQQSMSGILRVTFPRCSPA